MMDALSQPRRTYRCYHCAYKTDRKNNLKRHVTTMHESCDKALECCEQVFANKAELRCHVIKCHRQGYVCRECGRNFCRKALLKRHITVHSGQKDYSCEHCGYATSHKSNLDRHKRRHLPKEQQQQLAVTSSVFEKYKMAKVRRHQQLGVANTYRQKQYRHLNALNHKFDDDVKTVEGYTQIFGFRKSSVMAGFEKCQKTKMIKSFEGNRVGLFGPPNACDEPESNRKHRRLFDYNYVCPVPYCRKSFPQQINAFYHYSYCHGNEINDCSVRFMPPITVQIRNWLSHIAKTSFL